MTKCLSRWGKCMTGKAEDIIKWLFTQDREKLFDIEEHKDKRSLNANALLWKCLGDIANAIHSDKWTVYLQMLKRYGTYTYICVKPEAVEGIKKQWREVEEVGRGLMNGVESVQLLCYFGSSTMNTSEFSRLLDGVISELEEMGLPSPGQEELDRVIKQMERKEDESRD